MFVEAPETVAQIEEVARRLPMPKLINMFQGGKTPLVPLARMAPLVEREDPPAGHEPLGQMVPHARVAGDAVQEDDRRRVRRAPVQIMQRDAVDADGALGEGHNSAV